MKRTKLDELRERDEALALAARQRQLERWRVANIPVPALMPPAPVPPTVPVYRLSLDQMIGIFFACLVVSLTGITLKGLCIVGGLTLVVMGWRWLKRRAPVTADVILMVFGIFLLAFLGAGRRGRRRW